MTDIPLPAAVVEAAARALMRTGTYRYLELAEDDVPAALQAALRAWPGMCFSESVCGWSKWIELPLPEESDHAEA